MSDTLEQPKKQKRERSRALENAEEAVKLWFQRRLYLGKNRVQPKGENRRPVPDVPDEFLAPQRFIGPSTARPDGVTAWGVETIPHGRDRFPWGTTTSLSVVSRDERESMRESEVVKAETLALTERAMLRLILIEPRYFLAVEMWAAGYSEDNIAAGFKVPRYQAKLYIQCGMCWVAGCLIIKPDFQASMHLAPPRIRQRDLWRTCRQCKGPFGAPDKVKTEETHYARPPFCSPACRDAYEKSYTDEISTIDVSV